MWVHPTVDLDPLDPEFDLDDPSRDVDAPDPEFDLDDPSRDVDAPAANVAAPAANVDAPAANVAAPAVHAATSSTETTVRCKGVVNHACCLVLVARWRCWRRFSACWVPQPQGRPTNPIASMVVAPISIGP